MKRALIFVLSLMLAFWAGFAALPHMVNKSHMEKAVSLALGAEVSMEQHGDFRLLPSPRLVARNLKVMQPDTLPGEPAPEPTALMQLGLKSAETVSVGFTWARFLTAGGLNSVELSGARLEPVLDDDALVPLLDRAYVRMQNANVIIRNTAIHAQRNGQDLQPVQIDYLELNTLDDGDRILKGQIVLAGRKADMNLRLKPLRRLGQSHIQSFDIALDRQAESPSTGEALRLAGSLQLEEGLSPKLSMRMDYEGAAGSQDSEVYPERAKVTAALGWEQGVWSAGEIDLLLDDWALEGQLQGAASPQEENTPSHWSFQTANVPIDMVQQGSLYQGLQEFRRKAGDLFRLNAALGLPTLPIKLAVDQVQAGPFVLEDLQFQLMALEPQNTFLLRDVSFSTLAAAQLQAETLQLGDEIALRGHFTSSNPSVLLSALGWQEAGSLRRTSLPQLVATGSLDLDAQGFDIQLDKLQLAGDSFAARIGKTSNQAWDVRLRDGRLNADYLGQDFLPLDGIVQSPYAWLAQYLKKLPPFALEVDLENLQLGGLEFGQVAGHVEWHEDKSLRFRGLDDSGQMKTGDPLGPFYASNLGGAAWSLMGQVWLSHYDSAQGAERLKLDGFNGFALQARKHQQSQGMVDQGMVDTLLSPLMESINAASDFTLLPDSFAVQEIGMIAQLTRDNQLSGTVVVSSPGGAAMQFAGLYQNIDTARSGAGDQPWQVVWAEALVTDPQGLKLPDFVGASMAGLMPIDSNALIVELGQTASPADLKMTFITGPTLSYEDIRQHRAHLQDMGLAANQLIAHDLVQAEMEQSIALAGPRFASPKQRDYKLDYALNRVALPNADNRDDRATDVSLRGGLRVRSDQQAIDIVSQDLRVDDLNLDLALRLPKVEGAFATGRIELPYVALPLAGFAQQTRDKGAAGQALLNLPLSLLDEQRYTLDVSIQSLDLGPVQMDGVRTTAQSDGQRLSLLDLETTVSSTLFSGQGEVSLGLLPRLSLALQTTSLDQNFSLLTTPLRYKGAVQVQANGLGSDAKRLLDGVSLELELQGDSRIEAPKADALVAGLTPQLDASLGQDKRQRLQSLVFEQLVSRPLPTSGRLRYIDGLLRSSDLQLGQQPNYLRVSGRIGPQTGLLDLDLSLFASDPLIPDAALDVSGTWRAPTFKAFGTLLER